MSHLCGAIDHDGERGHMARDRQSYEAVLQSVGICVSARIPFLLWGDPGAGKTAVIESAAKSGWHVETLICSHYEPSDLRVCRW